MKRIKWELPFKSMDYLESMTEDLVNNPYIILITATEDHKGIVDSCTIGIRDNDNMDEVILLIGATIGAHSVSYTAQTMTSHQYMLGFCLGAHLMGDIEFKEKNEDLFEKAEVQEEEEIEEEETVTEEEIKEVIEKTPDSPAKALLRKILDNFKKTTLGVLLMTLIH